MKLTNIASYDNYFLANIIKSKLESNGIICFLKNENITTLYGAAFSQIIIQVPLQQREQAREILENQEKEQEEEQQTIGFWDDDLSELNPQNKICVFCGSKNTRPKEDNKDFFLLTWLFKKMKMNYQSDNWHCFHCGKEF